MTQWVQEILAGGVATVFAFIAYRMFLMLDELRKTTNDTRERVARMEGALSNGTGKEFRQLGEIDRDLGKLAKVVTDHVENEEERVSRWVTAMLRAELERWKARYDLRPKEG